MKEDIADGQTWRSVKSVACQCTKCGQRREQAAVVTYYSEALDNDRGHHPNFRPDRWRIYNHCRRCQGYDQGPVSDATVAKWAQQCGNDWKLESPGRHPHGEFKGARPSVGR